jgi:hypothetical protein
MANGNQQRPPELPPRTVSVSDRVFAFAQVSVLLVGLGLSALFGIMDYSLMHETMALRTALDQATALNAHCEAERTFGNGRLSEMERMVSMTAGKPFPTGSGVGGPAK